VFERGGSARRPCEPSWNDGGEAHKRTSVIKNKEQKAARPGGDNIQGGTRKAHVKVERADHKSKAGGWQTSQWKKKDEEKKATVGR